MQQAQQEEFLKYINRFTELLSKVNAADQKQMRDDFATCLTNVSLGRRLFEQSTFQLEQSFPYFTLRMELARFLQQIPFEDKKDVFNIASSYLFPKNNNVPESMDVDNNSSNSPTTQWLEQILSKLITRSDGRIDVTKNGKHATVAIRGHLPVLYAAYSFLANLTPDQQQAAILDDPDMTDLTITVDLGKVKKTMRQHVHLAHCRAWLDRQGYEVHTGSKACGNELFVNVRSVETRDDQAVRRECGITLSVADKLLTYGDYPVVFLTALQVVAAGKSRDQLELYYRETGLVGANQKPKEFIIDESGYKTNKSNISLIQGEKLWSYFQRLDMLSRRQNIALTQLSDEADAVRTQQKIRAGSLKVLQEKPVNPSNIGKSYLAKEADQIALVIPRPSNSTPSSVASMFSSRGAASNAAFSVEPGLTEEEFERQFERHVNDTFILGPEAFKLLIAEQQSDLSVGIQHLDSAIHSYVDNNDSDDGWEDCLAYLELESTPPKASSKALVPYHAGFIPTHSSAKIELPEYFLALAEHIAPNLMSSQYTMDKRRIAFLKETAVVNLTPRLDEIRSFYSTHTPYYFVKQLANTLANLMENPDLPEEAIGAILRQFGVKDSDMVQYQVKNMQSLNRYHIKFDALHLAYNACVNRKILIDFKLAQTNNSQWVYNCYDKRLATNNKEDVRRAVEFQLMEVFKPDWGVAKSNDQQTYKSHSSSGSQKTTYTAGSNPNGMFGISKPNTGSSSYSSSSGRGSSAPSFSFSSAG